jgi:antitoxin ChpS
MHETTLRKVGGSIMLSVPPALLDILRLQAGAKVGLSIDNGQLVVTPEPRTRYTLDELLAQCDHKAAITKEEREWLNDDPAGAELL